MNSKNESLEEIKNQEINYFKVIWGWKWAVILIPLIAMATAKLTEQPIPDIYETKASIVISGQGSRKPLSRSSFESIAFLPKILEKIIVQLSLKMADGTSMSQTTLKNQLKTKISGSPNVPVAPGFLFFIARNESPELAKKIADLWVRLVEKEAKKMEAFNFGISSNEQTFIKSLEQKLFTLKSSILSQNNYHLMLAKSKLAEKKSELSTYQKRLKTSSDSKVYFIPRNQPNTPNTLIPSDNSVLKNESSQISLKTSLHSALKGLILNKELEIEALNSKIHLLNNNIKNLEQELFKMAQAHFSGDFLEIFSFLNEAQPLKISSDKFVSSIASINDALVIKTPIKREKYTHILLAGLISFGFIILASVVKSHIDAIKPE